MSMYKSDQHGEYKCAHKWIRAWGGGLYVGGFNLYELREYADGEMRVHSGEPMYVKDMASSLPFDIYLLAEGELERLVRIRDMAMPKAPKKRAKKSERGRRDKKPLENF